MQQFNFVIVLVCVSSAPPPLVRDDDGWFAENFRCWPHSPWRVRTEGKEGEGTIISSAYAQIRPVRTSFRNDMLLHFAFGIWNGMNLRHAPEGLRLNSFAC